MKRMGRKPAEEKAKAVRAPSEPVRAAMAVSEWQRLAEMLRKLLLEMEERPDVYRLAQRIQVQNAIAIVTDPETAANTRHLATSRVVEMFGAFDDERPENPEVHDDAEAKLEEEIQSATTQDLLARVKGAASDAKQS